MKKFMRSKNKIENCNNMSTVNILPVVPIGPIVPSVPANTNNGKQVRSLYASQKYQIHMLHIIFSWILTKNPSNLFSKVECLQGIKDNVGLLKQSGLFHKLELHGQANDEAFWTRVIETMIKKKYLSSVNDQLSITQTGSDLYREHMGRPISSTGTNTTTSTVNNRPVNEPAVNEPTVQIGASNQTVQSASSPPVTVEPIRITGIKRPREDDTKERIQEIQEPESKQARTEQLQQDEPPEIKQESYSLSFDEPMAPDSILARDPVLQNDVRQQLEIFNQLTAMSKRMDRDKDEFYLLMAKFSSTFGHHVQHISKPASTTSI